MRNETIKTVNKLSVKNILSNYVKFYDLNPDLALDIMGEIDKLDEYENTRRCYCIELVMLFDHDNKRGVVLERYTAYADERETIDDCCYDCLEMYYDNYFAEMKKKGVKQPKKPKCISCNVYTKDFENYICEVIL